MSARRTQIILIGLALLLSAAALLRVLVGSDAFGWPRRLGDTTNLILATRLHRLALGLIVGSALAGGGVALQNLLRNPLAEPFILGLSTGAAAGVMAQAWLLKSLSVQLNLPPHIGALLGALATMAIVFAVGRRRGIIDPLGLLLTGVVLSTLCGALVMLFNYLVGPGGIRDDITRWMMGFLDPSVGQLQLYAAAAVTVAALVVLGLLARAMDAATFSDAEASSLGVNLTLLRTLLFAIAGILAAVAVTLGGPIAFVGFVAPHLARILLGPAHRTLIPAAVMLGAALIILADTAGSGYDLIRRQGEIPVGIFIALIGGPAFLWMLRPMMGRGSA
jgi:iron complex transport system permease protein